MSWRYKGGFIQEFFNPAQYQNLYLYSWGKNSSGQLAQGDTTYRSAPVQIQGTASWNVINAGFDFVLATKQDGTMWSSGLNSNGQLGLDTPIAYGKSSFTQIGFLTTWSKIGSGSAYALAIKNDGSLWSWGLGTNGQLGGGNIISRSSPVQVGSQVNWDTASGLQLHSLAIKNDGTLWAWGRNAAGQLGDGTVISRSSPVQIGSDTNWKKISGGQDFSVSVKKDGTMWAWGSGATGRTGQGDIVNRSSPTQIGTLTNWSQISGMAQGCMAVKLDGTLWAWGNNAGGQLGDGTVISRSSPVQIGSQQNWSIVQSNPSAQFTLAIISDGTLWSWGSGADGALGQNSTANLSSPTQIGTAKTWTLCAVGGNSFAFAASSRSV
jgi:alpha-tubulin suppressor-like RCC1 family protein